MSTLRWGIKRSLLEYTRGMADGTVELADGATEVAGVFAFPGEQHRFFGTVILTAHSGMMRIIIAEPEVVHSGAGWAIGITDPDTPESRLTFATVAQFDGHIGTGVALTTDGADLFFGPYTSGTILDDLTVED